MALKNQTELGLTFGQILSVIALLMTMGVSWVKINERMAKNEERVFYLEQSLNQSSGRIETMRIENKADFKEISDKLDKLILFNKSEK